MIDTPKRRKVRVTDSEIHQAAMIAFDRHFDSLARARESGLSTSEAERTATDQFEYMFYAFDVGVINVRRRPQSACEMILYPDDPDDEFFSFEGIGGNEVEVKGLILGREGKKKKYWRNRRDRYGDDHWAYYVPRSAMKPMDAFVDEHPPGDRWRDVP